MRDKLRGLEAPIGELPPLVLPTSTRVRYKSARWVITGISVAAAIALTIILIRPDAATKNISHPKHQLIAETEQEPIIKEMEVETDLNQVVKPLEQPTSRVLIAKADDFLMESNEIPLPNHEPIQEENIKESTPTIDTKEETSESVTPTKTELQERRSIQTLRTKKERGKVNLSLRGSLLTNSSSSDWPQKPMLFNSGGPMFVSLASTNIKKPKFQEMPLLDLGVSVGIPLTSNLHLQTGLGYSWRKVTATYNNYGHTFSEHLEIHALGIPIGLQYAIYQGPKWRMYGEMGLLGRVPIYSRLYAYKEHPGGATFSIAATGAMGAEYRISRNMGLFGSIGASYDIKPMKSNLTNSTLPPWHAEFHAGLRFWLK